MTSYIRYLLNMLLQGGEWGEISPPFSPSQYGGHGATTIKPFYINQSVYLGVMYFKQAYLF